MKNIYHIKKQARFCIREQLWDPLHELLEQLHPADIADLIEGAPDAAHNQIFDLLSEHLKADVLAELDDPTEADILEELTAEEISDIVEEMAPDDAADVLGELKDELSTEVLDLMEDEDSQDVRELLQYDEDTAGGRMTTDYVSLSSSKTAKEALDYISLLDFDEAIYSIYVTDVAGRLIGYVQLWQLLKAENHDKPLNKLAETDFFSAKTNTDQEDVARMMSKYDLSSLPVVDVDGQLVGRITIDDMIDVMEEEASEDIFKLAGSDDIELESSSPFASCKARLPWLLVTLVAGFISSLILKRFIDNHRIIALSFFVPIIMAMGGNTGIQSSTLIIRGLAIGSFNERKLYRLLGHEVFTGMLMGIICAAIIGIWAHFIIGTTNSFSSFYLAFTVGLALFCAMMFAAAFGAFVPLMLNRFKVDPAVASGPFVTASNDVISLLIYYCITFLLVRIHII